jgi:hypothetical protein
MVERSSLNPRLGYRERPSADATGVGQLDPTKYTVPQSSDGKLGQRLAQAALLQVVGRGQASSWTIDGTDPKRGGQGSPRPRETSSPWIRIRRF